MIHSLLNKIPYSNLVVAQNPIKRYFLALILLIVLSLALKIFELVILNNLKRISHRTKNNFDNIIISTLTKIKWPTYAIVSFYIVSQLLTLSAGVEKTIHNIFFITVTYQIIISLDLFLHDIFKNYFKKSIGNNQAVGEHLIKIIRVALWLTGIAIILSNLGYDISSLVTALGVSGIAVALAVQNIMSDIFSSFSLIIDKPFKIGDYITFNDEKGTVKKIGLKTTRITTIQGEELSVPNKELINSLIHNYQIMKTRQVDLTLNLTYQTSNKKIRKAIEIVKQVLENQAKTTLKRVHFKEMASDSLQIAVTYIVESPDYDIYLDLKEAINFSLKEQLEKAKIELAYPTQTIYSYHQK